MKKSSIDQKLYEKLEELAKQEKLLKLAKSIGLDHVPVPDPKAFDRLTGIIADKIDRKNFDSIELVKEVRDANFL